MYRHTGYVYITIFNDYFMRVYLKSKFWNDSFITGLSPMERYLYLYLFTNEHVNLLGVYELPLRVLCFETGLQEPQVSAMITNLTDKITYEDNWIILHNFVQHQSYNPNMITNLYKILNDDLPLHIKGLCEKRVKGLGRVMEGLPNPLININNNSNNNINLKPSPPKSFLDKIEPELVVEFDKFRKLYKKNLDAVARGNQTEMLDFAKKHKDFKEVIPKLILALRSEYGMRKRKLDKGDFVPPPKHLKTWLSQRSWETYE